MVWIAATQGLVAVRHKKASLPTKIKPGHALGVTGLDLNFVLLFRTVP